MSSPCLRDISLFQTILVSNKISELGLIRESNFIQEDVEKEILNNDKNLFIYLNDKNKEKMQGKILSKFVLLHLISANLDNLFQSKVPYLDYLSRCEVYKFSNCICKTCPLLSNGLTFKMCGQQTYMKINVLDLKLKGEIDLKRILKMLNLNLPGILIKEYYTESAFNEILKMSNNSLMIFQIIFKTMKVGLKCHFRSQVCGCGNCPIHKSVYWSKVKGIPHVDEDKMGVFVCNLTLAECTKTFYTDIQWLNDFNNVHFIGCRLKDEINSTIPMFREEIMSILSIINFTQEDYYSIMYGHRKKSYFNKKYGCRNMMRFVKTYNLWASNNCLSKIKWHCFKIPSIDKFAEEKVKEIGSSIVINGDVLPNGVGVFDNWDEMVDTCKNAFVEVLDDDEPIPEEVKKPSDITVSGLQYEYQNKIDNLKDKGICLTSQGNIPERVEKFNTFIDKVNAHSSAQNLINRGEKYDIAAITYYRYKQPHPNPDTASLARGKIEDAFRYGWPKYPDHKKGETCNDKLLKRVTSCIPLSRAMNEIIGMTPEVFAELKGYMKEGKKVEKIDYFEIGKRKNADYMLRILGFERSDERSLRFHKLNEEKPKENKDFNEELVISEKPIIDVEKLNFPLRRFKRYFRTKFLDRVKSCLKGSQYEVDNNFNFHRIDFRYRFGEDSFCKDILEDLLRDVSESKGNWYLNGMLKEFEKEQDTLEWRMSIKDIITKVINTFKQKIVTNIRNRKNQSKYLMLDDMQFFSLTLGLISNEYNLIKQIKNTTDIRSTDIRKLYRMAKMYDKVY
jgi:hypothetical protein